ncbi:MAG TPA: hypothetical protein VHE30_14845 [Polyangiaceae bacterium]|nr:hypothetical protein [Polyangiaceae bacterium]
MRNHEVGGSKPRLSLRPLFVAGIMLGAGFAACSPKNNATDDGPSNVAGFGTTFGGQGGQWNGGTGSVGALGGEAGTGYFFPDSGGPQGGSGAGQGSGGDNSGAGGAAIPPPADQPINVNECPGSVDANTAAALQAGSGSGGSVKILYPYDGTVLPVGLAAPVIQWSQTGAADAVYLHMSSAKFDYKGCTGANGKFQLNIPDTAWTPAQQQSQGATDPLNVEVTISSGGTITGPIKVQLVFALGKLKGDLFYNTYTSPQAGNNGAVMKLRLGAPTPQVLLTDAGIAPVGPCWSCHSLSANGNVLVAQHHAYPLGPYTSGSFDLVANPGLNPPPKVTLQSATAEMGLGAVYPDGSKVLTMGSPGNSSTASVNPLFPDAPGNIPAMIGTKASMLLDTATGNPISVSGWSVQYAKMPSFSPDGSLVAFNWHEDSSGHSLAVANFDTATNTFSNVRRIFKHDTLYPGWPFITPDNQEVVFVLGDAPDYVSAYPDRPATAHSDLWTVDIATGNARPLNRANGYMTQGAATYLPAGARDEHLEFFPTITPIAAGGYFWVFFTSRRTYGNILTDATSNLHTVDDAVTKKIWVSAYNIRTGDIIGDPSNPAFYLPGQEAAAGNIRAFAALEPCHAEGGKCETGVDCCGGHCCLDDSCAERKGTCGLPPPPPPPPPGEPPPPPRCSNIDEGCATAADCCPQTLPNGNPATVKCLRSFCAIPAPPR